MRNWRDILVRPDASIRDTVKVIDERSMQIALVVDAEDRLLGTVTDGDVRRGLLKGVPLTEVVSRIMNANPTIARPGQDRDCVLQLMQSKHLHHIPIVSEHGRVVGLEVLNDLMLRSRDNWVVLMAGGQGSRLRPLTESTPKPLLKVGNKPIMETILETFIEHGFRRFFFAINYKADMFRAYFRDGARWRVDIAYLMEAKPLGTAGALSLLPERPAKPMLVMNADLLTKVSFSHLLDFHQSHGAIATMGIREYDFQVPYGVVRIDNHRIVGIDEKPTHRFFVNAGMYVLEPSVLDLVSADTYLDMPSLFERVIARGDEAAVFPIREYWLDIGRFEDFDLAQRSLEPHDR
jgi:dTDP-glucose pyrophosphorylase